MALQDRNKKSFFWGICLHLYYSPGNFLQYMELIFLWMKKDALTGFLSIWSFDLMERQLVASLLILISVENVKSMMMNSTQWAQRSNLGQNILWCKSDIFVNLSWAIAALNVIGEIAHSQYGQYSYWDLTEIKLLHTVIVRETSTGLPIIQQNGEFYELCF